MIDPKSALKEMLATIEKQRDELALQIHLGKAEAKEEWERLEKRWQELKVQAAPVKDAATDTAHNVGSALGLAAEELKKGYDRVRKLL